MTIKELKKAEIKLNKRWKRMQKTKGIRLVMQKLKPQRAELAYQLMKTML